MTSTLSSLLVLLFGRIASAYSDHSGFNLSNIPFPLGHSQVNGSGLVGALPAFVLPVDSAPGKRQAQSTVTVYMNNSSSTEPTAVTVYVSDSAPSSDTCSDATTSASTTSASTSTATGDSTCSTNGSSSLTNTKTSTPDVPTSTPSATSSPGSSSASRSSTSSGDSTSSSSNYSEQPATVTLISTREPPGDPSSAPSTYTLISIGEPTSKSPGTIPYTYTLLSLSVPTGSSSSDETPSTFTIVTVAHPTSDSSSDSTPSFTLIKINQTTSDPPVTSTMTTVPRGFGTQRISALPTDYEGWVTTTRADGSSTVLPIVAGNMLWELPTLVGIQFRLPSFKLPSFHLPCIQLLIVNFNCPPPHNDDSQSDSGSGSSDPSSKNSPTTDPPGDSTTEPPSDTTTEPSTDSTTETSTDSTTESSSSSCTSEVTATDCRIMCSTAASAQGTTASTTCFSTSCSTVVSSCSASGTTSTSVISGTCVITIPTPGTSLDRLERLIDENSACDATCLDFEYLASTSDYGNPDWDDGTGDGDNSGDLLFFTDNQAYQSTSDPSSSSSSIQGIPSIPSAPGLKMSNKAMSTAGQSGCSCNITSSPAVFGVQKAVSWPPYAPGGAMLKYDLAGSITGGLDVFSRWLKATTSAGCRQNLTYVSAVQVSEDQVSISKTHTGTRGVPSDMIPSMDHCYENNFYNVFIGTMIDPNAPSIGQATGTADKINCDDFLEFMYGPAGARSSNLLKPVADALAGFRHLYDMSGMNRHANTYIKVR